MTAEKSTEGWDWPGTMVSKASGWSIALAVIFILLGIFAIAEPAVAGLAVTVLVGWLLIFGGVTHLVAAFSGGGAGRVIWQILLAIVYVFGGLYFLTHPLLGLGTLTLFLAAILLVEALLEFVAYFESRGIAGSGWLLANGLITLLLSGMIWTQWPSSSVWAIGILVGVNLLMTGFSRFMLGTALRRVVG